LRELSGLFTSQWGKLVEALVRPGLLDLFRQWGIAVNETLQRDRVRRDGREMEIDVMLVDGGVVIPVEVKTMLKIEDVRDFQRRMQDFLFFFPKYRGYRVFGAVAAVQIEEQADAMPIGKAYSYWLWDGMVWPEYSMTKNSYRGTWRLPLRTRNRVERTSELESNMYLEFDRKQLPDRWNAKPQLGV
jgi:hypothetical protein